MRISGSASGVDWPRLQYIRLQPVNSSRYKALCMAFTARNRSKPATSTSYRDSRGVGLDITNGRQIANNQKRTIVPS
jgi:hypothetical protein